MVKGVLERLLRGELSLLEAERMIKGMLNVEVVDSIARLDVWREARRKVPEIILAPGKPVGLVAELAIKMAEATGRSLVSKAKPEHLAEVLKRLSEGYEAKLYEASGLIVVKKAGFQVEGGGRVGLLTGGVADVGVAEEVEVVAREMGCEVYKFTDVGVANLARLREAVAKLWEADVDVVVVAAGREGALASVVASLVEVPVIGVPVSTGEGLGGRGVAALFSMLQSCSLGLAVVNIDGGVAAGVVASLIANRASKFRAVKKSST
ncbi:MAG: nickel pincer cofactor biosynthesis protein LarB [Candidatus Nezhaarchaeota archaeon]|nr:nickel pincer cofactor biosynthesis protein LarB [Candidatus Nezhaarchaeota archaeon]